MRLGVSSPTLQSTQGRLRAVLWLYTLRFQMSQRYSNQFNIPLPLAVFLATADYDFEPNVISATSLMKSTRQLVLSKRVKPSESMIDIAGLVSSRMGSAIHAAIEAAWLKGHTTPNYWDSLVERDDGETALSFKSSLKNLALKGLTAIGVPPPVTALKALGYSNLLIKRIVVNPSPTLLGLMRLIRIDPIPVYMEQRAYKQVGQYRVSGKFDFVAEGRVQDFKSTSVYGYLNQTNAEKYSLQGSIYRWLNQDIISKPDMTINYIFTDWSAADAKQNPEYPQARVHVQRIPLLSIKDTENYVVGQLRQLDMYKDSDETELPLCNDKDLWRKATVWKYFKNPAKTERSTKNFDNANDAYARQNEDGSVGIVKEIKGGVVACRYCNAFDLCTQKDAYLSSGELTLT